MMAEGKRKRRRKAKRGSVTRSNSGGDSSQSRGKKQETKAWLRVPLDMKEHHRVRQSLDELEPHQLLTLGGALGLYRNNLKKMNILTLQDDMVSAWLRREDSVLSTSGEPSWYNLCKALREVSQTGIAQKIETEIQYQKTKESTKTAKFLRHYERLWNQYTSPTYYWDYHPKMVIAFLLALIALSIGSIVISLPHILTSLERAKVSHAKTLPYITQTFMGRDKELDELIDLLEFDQMNTRIVSLTGPPGFGKSALAIKIGHHFALQRLAVLYVDMHDSTDMRGVAEKVLEGAGITTKNATPKRMYKWLRDRNEHTILILDNCDDVLDKNKDEFQHAVQQILESSQLVKVLLTSRHKVVWVDDAYEYTLNELRIDFSKKLLQSIVTRTTLDDTSAESLANLTGNVPLALKVVGSLLNKPDPPSPQTVIEELKWEPMKTLSPQRLPRHEQVYASIRVSYRYLEKDVQHCGQVIAHFPGSFNLESANAILQNSSSSCCNNCQENNIIMHSIDHECASTLTERSLLDYSEKFHQYKFHKLLKDFFLYCAQQEGQSEVVSGHFEQQFQCYFSWVLSGIVHEFEDHSYSNALKKHDYHKQNIHHLVNNVAIYIKKYSCQAAVASMDAILKGFSSKMLMCRYNKVELRRLAANMTQILSEHSNYSSCIRCHYDPEWLFMAYTGFVTEWTDLVSDLYNSSYALYVIAKRWPYVETLMSNVEKTSKSRSVDVHYINFYSTLGEYYRKNGKHEDYRQCHAKILAKGQQLNTSDPANCDYWSIALAYYNAKEYEKCIPFFQTAMHERTMSNSERITVLSKIYRALKHTGKSLAAEQTMQEIIDIVQRMHVIDVKTLQEENQLEDLYVLFMEEDKPEANIVLEKMVSLLMKDKKSLYSAEKAYILMKSFYSRSDYTNATKFGEFAVDALKASGHEKTTLNVESLAVLSQVKLLEGNFSECIRYLTMSIQLIDELPDSAVAFAMESVSQVCVFVFWIEWKCFGTLYRYFVTVAEKEFMESSEYYSQTSILSAPSATTELSSNYAPIAEWYYSFQDKFTWLEEISRHLDNVLAKSKIYALGRHAKYYLTLGIPLLFVIFLCMVCCGLCCCITLIGYIYCSCTILWFQLFKLAWFLSIPAVIIPVIIVYLIGDTYLTLGYYNFLLLFMTAQWTMYVLRNT